MPVGFDEWSAGAGTVESGGLSVAFHDRGDPGDPVFTYCHGYPSSSHDVLPVLELLDGWRLVAPDFIGFGASDKPRGRRLTIADQADVVEACWTRCGVESTVLHCHDYGVSVGQELLARRADGSLGIEVTAVVWHNGGLYPDLHRPTDGQKLLRDPEQGPELVASMTEELFRAGIGVTWGTRVPMTDELIHEMWVGMERNGGVLMAHELLHYMDDRVENADRWRSALEDNGLPQSFVWGALDPVSGAHVMERLAERLPRADHQLLDDVGHWPTLEAPDAVAAALDSHRPQR